MDMSTGSLHPPARSTVRGCPKTEASRHRIWENRSPSPIEVYQGFSRGGVHIGSHVWLHVVIMGGYKFYIVSWKDRSLGIHINGSAYGVCYLAETASNIRRLFPASVIPYYFYHVDLEAISRTQLIFE